MRRAEKQAEERLPPEHPTASSGLFPPSVDICVQRESAVQTVLKKEQKHTKTRELATKVEGEALREEDGVAERCLLSSAQVERRRTGSVEGESSLGIVSECI